MNLMKPGRTKQLFTFGPRGKWGKSKKGRKRCVAKGEARFALAPRFARPECETALSHCPVSFSSYGNTFYVGYLLDVALLRCMTTPNDSCKGD